MYTKKFEPFENKVWLASPTMHGEEFEYITEAYKTNWMSTVGENIDEVERIAAKGTGMKYAVALSCCTAALHLCVKLAGERLYGKPTISHGVLEGKKVFCSDVTFNASVNPVIYEGGTPIFIDTNEKSFNMDYVALEKAFEIYPDVKLVIMAHLYGFPGNIQKIKDVCHQHGALLIEDAAEAVGATVDGKPCGCFGDYNAISYNGNKIITGSAGGCLLTNDPDEAAKARKWSTQSKDNASWYQHTEVGYNYRMSNVVAGVIRGQYKHLDEHIAQKKAIYERYKDGLKDLPIEMNPILPGTEPNYWLSALVIDKDYMCQQVRGEMDVTYNAEHGKSCPTEILDAIKYLNAEGRPIWKPMHLQPLYENSDFVTRSMAFTHNENSYDDAGTDIFQRGCCLPSDNKMTEAQQARIIEVVKACFE